MPNMGFDPTKIDSNAGEWMPGQCHDGYQYVYYDGGDGNVTAVVGQIAYLAISGTRTVPVCTVTQDVDTTTAIDTSLNLAWGEFCSALTTGKYGWIKKKGLSDNQSLTHSSGVDTIGDAIIAGATQGSIDGIGVGVDTVYPIIGYARAVDSTNALAAGGVWWDFPGYVE